jgi:hypothetical protein
MRAGAYRNGRADGYADALNGRPKQKPQDPDSNYRVGYRDGWDSAISQLKYDQKHGHIGEHPHQQEIDA